MQGRRFSYVSLATKLLVFPSVFTAGEVFVVLPVQVDLTSHIKEFLSARTPTLHPLKTTLKMLLHMLTCEAARPYNPASLHPEMQKADSDK